MLVLQSSDDETEDGKPVHKVETTKEKEQASMGPNGIHGQLKHTSLLKKHAGSPSASEASGADTPRRKRKHSPSTADGLSDNISVTVSSISGILHAY